MKKVGNMAKGFDGAIKGIVGGIKDGIDLFKQIISGKLSFKKMITDFVDALENLPKTVRTIYFLICRQMKLEIKSKGGITKFIN